jgi:hypothetical protein
MRTAATVKAAERADGVPSSGASAVYQAAAAALSAAPSIGKSLQEERERLKAKVSILVFSTLVLLPDLIHSYWHEEF